MNLASMTWLTKQEFMERYAKSDSKYNERITELRANPEFKKAYISPSNKEVWIVEEIYKNFLIWKASNRFK